MSIGITFGSVGDIIAVGQIAHGLVKALSDSKGSAKAYQELVAELTIFHEALEKVIVLWQNHRSSPELDELGELTKKASKELKVVVLAFRLKVDGKYGTSLGPGGSGNWIKDASKKVLWLKEKEDVAELRRMLQSRSSAINMLYLAAMMNSTKLDNAARAARVDVVSCMLRETLNHAEEQMALLKEISEMLRAQDQKSDEIITKVDHQSMCLTQIHSTTIDINSQLSMFRRHLDFQSASPRGLSTHWRQEPVTLQDALGRILPIPLELITSWKMLDMVVAEIFSKHVGYSKVKKGEWTLEVDGTGSELKRTSDWSTCVRPGQKIAMSICFNEKDFHTNSCPRCRTVSDMATEDRIQCNKCNLSYQRVTEFEDDEEDLSAPETSIIRLEKSTRTPRRRSSGKTATPADFERVRLLRKLAKLNDLGDRNDDVNSLPSSSEYRGDINDEKTTTKRKFVESPEKGISFTLDDRMKTISADLAQFSAQTGWQGHAALRDYQMQLMLLDQHNNRKRLKMLRQEPAVSFHKTESRFSPYSSNW